MQNDKRNMPPQHSSGLFDTLWPSDHGNTARQKFVVDGGLPENFDPAKIRVDTNPDICYPQWMYTREQDEIFVYAPPANIRVKAYFAKVNAKTLEVIQRIELPQIIYIGGALMHRGGDVFLMHGSKLYRFPQGDLANPTIKDLPLVNGFFTQSNGMLVAHDGNLIIKMWSITHHDLDIIRRLALVPIIPGAIGGLTIGALMNLGPAGILSMGVAGSALAFMAPLLKTNTSLAEFLKPTKSGHLLVVDPETLEIVDQIAPPERVAFGRMAMTAVNPEHASGVADGVEHEGEWIVIPGDEHVMRWHYNKGKLSYDADWCERYRSWGDGSFPGTGPSIYNRQVYYTDNTFPVKLKAGYRLFRKDLDSQAPQQVEELAEGKPGFMFWSTVNVPSHDIVVVWDTNGGYVDARNLDDLTLKWRTHLFNTDCISAASGKGHIYAVDHSDSLNTTQMLQSASRRPHRPDIEKFFIVLDAENGEEKLRISLGKAAPNASLILPGYNNDVFVGSRRGLIRIYQSDD